MLFDTFSSLTLDQQLLLLLLLKKYTIYENNEKWQAVLEGYKQYRELSEYELSLMKIFVEIREFWDTTEFLRFGYFYG
jgi:hypothetical protein